MAVLPLAIYGRLSEARGLQIFFIDIVDMRAKLKVLCECEHDYLLRGRVCGIITFQMKQCGDCHSICGGRFAFHIRVWRASRVESLPALSG